MHWCQDETTALVGALSSAGLAWAWLRHKVRGWWERRRWKQVARQRAEEVKVAQYCSADSTLRRRYEEALKALKGEEP